MTPIYLDYNATTPLDPAVLDAMLPYLQMHFGNPSSTPTKCPQFADPKIPREEPSCYNVD